MSKKNKKNKATREASDYSRDAFLTNPAASPTEWTGLAVTVPETGAEAKALEETFGVPVTQKRSKKAK